ncbi:hypothetical protein D3C73_1002460 [compost metagenome]|jgi:hypothetical protein
MISERRPWPVGECFQMWPVMRGRFGAETGHRKYPIPVIRAQRRFPCNPVSAISRAGGASAIPVFARADGGGS